MIVFYARCSTEEQNEARQIEMAKSVKAEKIFLDKATGRNTDRPALKEMMSFVREGDEIIVESFSRLARSTKDLLFIVDQLSDRKVNFKSLKEEVNTATPQGQFMLTIWSAMAELEIETTRQRTMEGIAIAKAQGKYKGRKPMVIDEVKFSSMVTEWKAKKRTATSIFREFGMSNKTFYKLVKKMKKE